MCAEDGFLSPKQNQLFKNSFSLALKIRAAAVLKMILIALRAQTIARMVIANGHLRVMRAAKREI
jgi:hypothetical protein